MIEFLLKSTISLAILLAVYYLFLQNEKMHRFNRFYLLATLVFSFAIPFVTIEIIEEIVIETAPATVVPAPVGTQTPIDPITSWPLIFGLIYGATTLILLWRFTRNILKFYTIERKSEQVLYKNARLILINDKTLPYTFGNRIFINKADYEARKIEDELFAHELVHVNEKHTLDILLIEILKTVMWFNPLLYLYKKAIQLNHEFLADEEVVISFRNVPSYQNLLLSKSSFNAAMHLASQLNFQLTKKRLLMMTKTTSAKTAMIKKVILLPVIVALIYFTCFETIAQTKEIQPAKSDKFAKDSKEAYDKAYAKKVKKDSIETSEARTLPAGKVSKKEYVAPIQDSIYNMIDLTNRPDFPDGMRAFYQFIAENYVIPESFSGSGRVFVNFVVEKDGSLSNMKVFREVGNGTGAEALRVLALSPKWTPGKINGAPVRCLYSVPIMISQK